KVWNSFDEVISDIPDGTSVCMYFWGFPGSPQNLIRALKNNGAKDITLIIENYIPTPLPPEMFVGPNLLAPQIKKLITPYYVSSARLSSMGMPMEDQSSAEQFEVEPISHGLLMARLRAGAGGLGGFYSPVGVGTILEEGKEKRIINGKEYILEMPLRPEFGFVRAHKADKYGNLTYLGVGRGSNPIMAMASEVTIAEVDEIVEPGELDPEAIVTPAAFVDRIVQIPPGSPGGHQHLTEQVKEILKIEWFRTPFLATKKQEAS
ncbi:MAG: 3-oxoacid CoA-transferase subunit A, partial [Chloroflexota bacterium]|nr:3-oxoacid CoA-transferase subunit A [Chloroflexota bacterium]